MSEVLEGGSDAVSGRSGWEWELLGQENNSGADPGAPGGWDVDLIVAIVMHGWACVPSLDAMV